MTEQNAKKKIEVKERDENFWQKSQTSSTAA